MKELKLTIPGKPAAKARPFISRVKGRTPVAFTPAKTRHYESIVREVALREIPEPPMFEGPVTIIIKAYFKPPKSWSNKKKVAAIGNPHIQRPDIDNIGKIVVDGLNRIVWRDDSQIWSMTLEKSWDEEERVEVTIIGKEKGDV